MTVAILGCLFLRRHRVPDGFVLAADECPEYAHVIRCRVCNRRGVWFAERILPAWPAFWFARAWFTVFEWLLRSSPLVWRWRRVSKRLARPWVRVKLRSGLWMWSFVGLPRYTDDPCALGGNHSFDWWRGTVCFHQVVYRSLQLPDGRSIPGMWADVYVWAGSKPAAVVLAARLFRRAVELRCGRVIRELEQLEAERKIRIRVESGPDLPALYGPFGNRN